MSDLCSVALTGNLTRDPELREIRGGGAVCRMRLGYARRHRSAEGEWTERPNYVDLTAFAGQARVCSERLGKGSRVGVIGELRWSSYETRNGVSAQHHEVVVREIQFLSPPSRPGEDEDPPEPLSARNDPNADVPF